LAAYSSNRKPAGQDGFSVRHPRQAPGGKTSYLQPVLSFVFNRSERVSAVDLSLYR
jgi:hypothetical protein